MAARATARHGRKQGGWTRLRSASSPTTGRPAVTDTTPFTAARARISGVILAGGRATRMGGKDKGLVRLHGRPMVEYVIERLRPQVGRLVINANRNLSAYRRVSADAVVCDTMADFAGPLAGMASAMQAVDSEFLLTVPCDSPLLAEDLAERLYTSLMSERAEVSVASDGARLQPVFALLRCTLLPSLLEYLSSGERKIDRWYAGHGMATADMSDHADSFLNINTPEERELLERRLMQVNAQ